MKTNPLTYRLNAYFAVLAITIIGGGATLLIVHIATDSTSLEAAQIQALNF